MARRGRGAGEQGVDAPHRVILRAIALTAYARAVDTTSRVARAAAAISEIESGCPPPLDDLRIDALEIGDDMAVSVGWA